MNSDPHSPNTREDETLPPEWIAGLRALPSEQAAPSCSTDTAILAAARASLTFLRRRKKIHRLWPALAAAACLAFALIFLSQRGHKPQSGQVATSTEDKYAVILREVSSVFPHQVKAIMTDGGELQIALSDEPLAEGSQAVVIEACGNGGCTVVITYVGQTVEIGRQQVTVQVDEKGVIIIKGKQDPAPDLQIKTRRI